MLVIKSWLSQVFISIFTFDDVKDFTPIVCGRGVVADCRETAVGGGDFVFVFTTAPEKCEYRK